MSTESSIAKDDGPSRRTRRGALCSTPSGPAEHGRLTPAVTWFAVAAAVGGFLFGFDTAVINGAVTALESNLGLDAVGLGVVVAVTLLGAALGALGAGWLADRIGRPRTMLAAGVVFFVAAIGCGLAQGVIDLAAWRLVTGIAVGFATVLGPLYISEITPAHARGRLASMQQMAIVLGIFAALLSDSGIALSLGGADAEVFLGLPAWRWMFIAGVVPALIYLMLALVVPESPRYLVARGQVSAARRVLIRLQRVDETEARVLTDRIAETLQHRESGRFRDLLHKRHGLLPVVWVGIGVAALQALVGIDVIFYYSTSLWESVGFEESAAFGLSVFSSFINVAATVAAIVLIDRVGRRVLLLTGSVGMFVSLVLVSIGFSTARIVDGAPQLGGVWGPITLIGANLFVVAFAVSWGPVVWVLLGEMFPNRIRAVALSVCASANWLAGVALNFSFPSLRDVSLPGSYALYAVTAALSFVLVYFGVEETNGRSLEEMPASAGSAEAEGTA
ncbi:sugar porter family MFS transporter [Microbacterium esteraromaticum]|uniref:sugar porter family MFS transporter n=1 Tax=Microbacterium esteraromaticum TaxID=57043 RepID=UPI001958F4CB|nr:sugar porter family MFS transporter [Microbacterium esteraromaticum]MBM7466283.1 sugar porter (SP) family MFS transporter [Microbacterium esteraromaticum]